ALTMLGIIIGLAAVIILVSYAQGQNAALRAYYESMGNNTISLYAYSYGNSGPQDVGSLIYDYCLQLDDVVGVTPNGYVYSSPTIKYESKTLSQNNGSGGIMMGGGVIVSPSGGSYNEDYPQIYLGNDKFGLCNDYEIAKGRDLSYLDVEKSNQVCVLGAATAEYLFSFADPIDKTITVNGMPFRVIGVYKSKGNTQIGGREEDQWMQESMKQMDRMILLPSTMTRYFNNNDPIQDYVVKVRDAGSIAKVTTSILGYLSGIIDTNNGYYGVNSNEEYLQQEDEATAMQQRFLGGIAAISLLVGGIGIMNIMLVTVTERTREIGIRKAIGAERRSIVTQFLIEASMICGIGGIMGIIVGYLGTLIVGKLSFNTILIPNPGTAVAAFLVSVALGIIFGLYPAVKASGLQPVVALRAE
ncbi:ABC transporter permease, partial [uncultured Intestinimonas sp.]|uniref:ABC transporter permease n=1 Tax=uncultured Intestinimonas sp. TaxID=1689265 RepID=UPI00262BCCCD